MKHELIVIGGGASGVAAAINAKDMGLDVAIVEAKDRICKKLLVTGNGRCNITNNKINPCRYHSENASFVKETLEAFTLNDTINFFKSLGLPLITLEEGKMYPMSLQASSVIDILRLALEERDIPVYLNSKINNIKKLKNGFNLETSDNRVFNCKKIILSTGGKSAVSTGSDGSGYTLSKALGHSIVKQLPALIQLKLDNKNLKALAGVKFNGYASIFIKDKLIKTEFGEILFTDYGISGPPILQLSRTASSYLNKNCKVSLTVDMLPYIKKEHIKEFLENHWAQFSYRSVYNSLIGIIHKKIISTLLKEASVADIHKPSYQLTWNEKECIISLLKSWTFNVSGTNSFDSAQVTCGGINTLEVNSSTLESKIVPNLYFCGEVLDVDGDCGGFNLQWAWSSAFIASKSAREK